MTHNMGENTGQPLQQSWSGLPKDEDQGCHQDSPAVEVRNLDAIRNSLWPTTHSKHVDDLSRSDTSPYHSSPTSVAPVNTNSGPPSWVSRMLVPYLSSLSRRFEPLRRAALLSALTAGDASP